MALARFSRRALLNAEDDRLMASSANFPEGLHHSFGLERGDYRMIPDELLWPTGYAGRMQMPTSTVPVQSRFVGRHSSPSSTIRRRTLCSVHGLGVVMVAGGLALDGCMHAHGVPGGPQNGRNEPAGGGRAVGAGDPHNLESAGRSAEPEDRGHGLEHALRRFDLAVRQHPEHGKRLAEPPQSPANSPQTDGRAAQ
jgi:hypothetical protein